MSLLAMPKTVRPFLGVHRRAPHCADAPRREQSQLVPVLRSRPARVWEPIGKDVIAIAMGAFDGPTGTRLAMHIHVADKGDYYAITDGVPQHPH